MYSVDDIMKRLNAGEDAEDIAQEFTDALNSALNEKKAADEAAAKAAAAADAMEVARNARVADAWDVADPLNAFLAEHYPELAKSPISAEEIVDLFDSVVELNHSLGMLKLSTFPFQKKDESKKICKKSGISNDEVIRKFIDNLF